MKSNTTAVTLAGAALLLAAAAGAQPTTPGRAMNGTLIETTVPSANVPGPVPITYYLPKNYDAKRAERYPLLIQLHGGAGSNKAMENFPAMSVGGGMGGLLDQAIENGLVAPMVSVMPSTGRTSYMNFRDGSHTQRTHAAHRDARDERALATLYDVEVLAHVGQQILHHEVFPLLPLGARETAG